MRDLVVTGLDRIHRPDAGGNMAVDMQAELMRFVDAGFEPRWIERPVEFYSGETFLLGLVDQRDRFGLAGRDIGDLRGVRTFAIDQ